MMIIYYSILAVMIAATVLNLWSARQYRNKLAETNDDNNRALNVRMAVTAAPARYSTLSGPAHSVVCVMATHTTDGVIARSCVKEYHYDPTDADDRSFAMRQAEELIEKLEEK